MNNGERPSELARELLIGTAAFCIAVAALCILAAQAPRRKRAEPKPPAARPNPELARLHELEVAERELAGELESACEVALVAIELGGGELTPEENAAILALHGREPERQELYDPPPP